MAGDRSEPAKEPAPASPHRERVRAPVGMQDEQYGSALCMSPGCRWKLEGYENGAEGAGDLRARLEASKVAEAAREHALAERHQVSLVVTSHITFDARAVRPA